MTTVVVVTEEQLHEFLEDPRTRARVVEELRGVLWRMATGPSKKTIGASEQMALEGLFRMGVSMTPLSVEAVIFAVRILVIGQFIGVARIDKIIRKAERES